MKTVDIWAEPLIPSFIEVIMIIFILAIVYFIANSVKNKRQDTEPAYAYFKRAIMFKLFIGLAFCIIYTMYYGGGDTTGYFISSKALVNLLFKDPTPYFKMLFGLRDLEHKTISLYYSFDASTGWPDYWRDSQSFAVVRFTSIFALFSYKSYYISTMFTNIVTFFGAWKLFLVFSDIYPKYIKRLAFAILFVPSVAFWGSGILKDNYTLAGACWLTYNFYAIFIKKKKLFINILLAIINLTLIITLKPYIFVALFPGILLWTIFNRVKNIKNNLLRVFATPVLIIVGLIVGVSSLSLFGDSLGKYSDLDAIAHKAQITQQDLTREGAYGSNYYDIGKFDASAGGMIAKAPVSIIAGLFRPFLWEVKNPVMLISGIENFILLLVFFYVLFKVGPIKLIKIIGEEPLLFFSVSFSIIFAFSVGLASANFGALVRYRILCTMYFVPALVILYERLIELKGDNNK